MCRYEGRTSRFPKLGRCRPFRRINESLQHVKNLGSCCWWRSWTSKWKARISKLLHERVSRYVLRPVDYGSDHKLCFITSYFKNSEDDEIPWCLTCFHAQPNEPGVGCTYLEYDHSNDQYRGLGDYPCGDLDVITIDPEEKQECFVNFIEPEDCSRYSLCLIRNSSDSASYSLNLLILNICVLLNQFLN